MPLQSLSLAFPLLALLAAARPAGARAAENPEVEKLAKEVGRKGWLVFSARTRNADLDLYLARPDGSGLRNITNSPGIEERGARFSPDGQRLLYRRLNKGNGSDHVDWGHLGVLVIAKANGSKPVPQGKSEEYPWAIWGPDGTQIACLYRRESKIRIFDLVLRRLVKEVPNQGIFRQLGWSPDGQRFCGPASIAGADWNIASLEIATGKLTQVSRGMNCTPDWFQNDPLRIVYSSGISEDNDAGWVALMQGAADGKSRTLIYAERKRHIYFGCTSPDDRYVLFSRRTHNGGRVEGPMAIVRLADTPMIGPEPFPRLEDQWPKAARGPILHLRNLPDGFEPHWTYSEVGGPAPAK